MSFINILKRPFEYNEDLDKKNIIDSLITMGISIAVCIVTIILSVVISSNKAIGAASGLLGGYGNLSGAISGKMIFTVFYASLIGYIIGVLVMVGLVFAIRKFNNKEVTFIQCISLVSSSLVLPSAITPLVLIGVIFMNEFGILISVVVMLVSFILLLINLFEGLKAVGGVGSGRAIYLVSTSTIIYYGLVIYITIKIITQSIIRSIYSFY